MKLFRIFLLILVFAMLLAGCGEKEPDMAFEKLDEASPYRISTPGRYRAVGFGSELCIVSDNNGSLKKDDDDGTYGAALIFDLKKKKPVFSDSVFKKLYPASTTKLMTAILAMKHSDKDKEVVCSANVKITEPGAQLVGFEEGDRLTMDQAMHALLLYSANDAAVAIAETIGGSVEGFADMMNEEARTLGCQGTHFVNPHGLHDDDHYTTAYDLYLMMNEAAKYDWFMDICGTKEYTTQYSDAAGGMHDLLLKNTNLYIRGDQQPPEGISVLAGKTGTTTAAANNLVLYCTDSGGNPYISVVMKSSTRAWLYQWMNRLLEMPGQT